MVEYSYDAWGNQQVSGSNIKLGNLNPFRYRSYFYDTESNGLRPRASLSNIGNIYLSRERNRGRDTGLMGLSDEDLDKELKDAKRKHDSERIQKILKEMKIRGLRNKRKQRGGPHMRGFLLILLGIGAGLYNESRN